MEIALGHRVLSSVRQAASEPNSAFKNLIISPVNSMFVCIIKKKIYIYIYISKSVLKMADIDNRKNA